MCWWSLLIKFMIVLINGKNILFRSPSLFVEHWCHSCYMAMILTEFFFPLSTVLFVNLFGLYILPFFRTLMPRCYNFLLQRYYLHRKSFCTAHQWEFRIEFKIVLITHISFIFVAQLRLIHHQLFLLDVHRDIVLGIQMLIYDLVIPVSYPK